MTDSVPADLPADLAAELRYFRDNFHELLTRFAEQFVVIKSQRVVLARRSFADAYDAGVAAFGTERFLVQPVVEPEQEARFLSRHVE